jgi:hypothetical protein
MERALTKLQIASNEELGGDTSKLLEFAWMHVPQLEELLNEPPVAVAGANKLTVEKRGGFEGKVMVSMFGPVRIQREYYYHPERGCGRYPRVMIK